MSRSILIGEGGGTKTDWIYFSESEDVSFTTSSLHSEVFAGELLSRLSNCDLTKTQIIVFSSGCYRDEGAASMREKIFDQTGLKALVYSDLHAAGIAAYGFNSGWCMISGTGSVLFHWNGTSPELLRGGEGPVIGDEASAFFFGKLVLEDYCKRESVKEFNATLESKCILLNDVKQNKSEIASISYLLSNRALYNEFHRLNVLSFADKHLCSREISELVVIGSYAKANSRVFSTVFSEYGVNQIKFIERPITSLIEQRHRFID